MNEKIKVSILSLVIVLSLFFSVKSVNDFEDSVINLAATYSSYGNSTYPTYYNTSTYGNSTYPTYNNTSTYGDSTYNKKINFLVTSSTTTGQQDTSTTTEDKEEEKERKDIEYAKKYYKENDCYLFWYEFFSEGATKLANLRDSLDANITEMRSGILLKDKEDVIDELRRSRDKIAEKRRKYTYWAKILNKLRLICLEIEKADKKIELKKI